MAQSIKLLSTTTRVEAPFIEINIGGYVFGKYTSKIEKYTSVTDGFTRRIIEKFPNFVKSLTVQKVNGQVNTYTLTLVYVIQPGDDPNKVDKILSSVSSNRKMLLSYGDCNSPTFMFREEEALITNVQQQINLMSSSITYTITAVSSSKLSMMGNYYFPAFKGKPSDRIKWVLQRNAEYGLKDVFYGMRDDQLVEDLDLIDDSDKEVSVAAKSNISPYDYLIYLVSCMCALSDDDTISGRHRYIICCYDDTTGELGGPYFRVKQVANNIQETTSLDTYEVDIGFPDADLVTNLSINENQAYAILYNYSEDIGEDLYIYRVNDNGGYDKEYSPNVMWDKTLYKATESQKTWWALMTLYPISVELTIKGLLRPSILMNYVKLNTMFYNRKHSSSGTYIITKLIDLIDDKGYRSTLSLTRIKGDSEL